MRSLFFALQADGVLVQIRAVVETYVGDYGLENCTLSARRMHGEDGASVAIDVSLLPSLDGRNQAAFLDMLTFAAGTESTTRPFHCAGRTSVFFEFDCRTEGCHIDLPLEGVTSLSK